MDFPSILPKPSQTYSSQVDPSLAITEFEADFRQRQRFTKTEEKIQVQWQFGQLQYDLFKKFVQDELIRGSIPFNVDVIGLDGLTTLEVQLLGGKFGMAYRPHRQYVVSATLVVKSSPVMDDDLYDFLTSDEGQDPDLFVLTGNVLYEYLHEVYGESADSDLVAGFMSSYG